MDTKQKIKKKLEWIHKLNQKLAEDRDRLRREVNDLNELIESLDTAVDDMKTGMQYIESALDSASQYM